MIRALLFREVQGAINTKTNDPLVALTWTDSALAVESAETLLDTPTARRMGLALLNAAEQAESLAFQKITAAARGLE